MVRAATAALAEHGCNATSMKDIAHNAGVATGLLHYYFASKDELLLAVIDSLDDQLSTFRSIALRATDDPLERVTILLDAASQLWTSQAELSRLVIDLSTYSLSNPSLHRRSQQLWQSWINDLELSLRAALGTLPAYAVAGPRELSETVVAALHGIALAALVREDDAARHFQTLKLLVLSVVVSAHVAAGQTPPMEHLRTLLDGATPHTEQR